MATAARPRALDWACAAMILTWGAALAVPGDTLASSPAYAGLLGRFGEAGWAILLIAIGAARCAALVINGWWRQSPLLRSAAALLGAVVWSQLLWAFVAASAAMGVMSAGVPFAAVMLFADLYSTARAARDYMHARQRHGLHHR